MTLTVESHSSALTMLSKRQSQPISHYILSSEGGANMPTARALFKSWFVDFDPVRAKAALKNHSLLEGSHHRPLGPYHHSPSRGSEKTAEGRIATSGGSNWTVERARAYLDAMDPRIVDLFPDRLVPSELREIPEGWEVKALGELVKLNPREILKRGMKAPYLDMAALPVLGPSPEKPVLRQFKSGTRFRNGDTLFARITPCLENGKTAFLTVTAARYGWLGLYRVHCDACHTHSST